MIQGTTAPGYVVEMAFVGVVEESEGAGGSNFYCRLSSLPCKSSQRLKVVSED
jgi:hypothetical protein